MLPSAATDWSKLLMWQAYLGKLALRALTFCSGVIGT